MHRKKPVRPGHWIASRSDEHFVVDAHRYTIAARWTIAVVAIAVAWPCPLLAQQGRGLFDFDPENMNTRSETVAQAFPLKAEHGPIMVRVASFEGDDAMATANLLAKELREKHRVETFTFKHQLHLAANYNKDEIAAFERDYGVKPRVMKFRTQPPPNWVVLAGQFDAFDSRAAESTLKKIRRIDPMSLPKSVRIESIPNNVQINNKLFQRAKDGLPNPLESAMLVVNPLSKSPSALAMSPERRKMLRQLNDDEEYSVYHNQAPYTIKVAQFYGASGTIDDKAKKSFSILGKKTSSWLEKAAANSVLLADQLRKTGHEAYVFHGKYGSIVCVGGYDSPNDPQLRPDLQKYAKTKVGQFALEPQLIPTPRRPDS